MPSNKRSLLLNRHRFIHPVIKPIILIKLYQLHFTFDDQWVIGKLYAFWFLIVIDQAVTDKYQSMNIYDQEQVIREMGKLIVQGSKDYDKKDVLHLLRQANKEAFITEEENTIIFENVSFKFENNKLVNVQ